MANNKCVSLMNSKIIEMLCDYVEREARVSSVKREEVLADVKTIMQVVDQINACNELDTRVGSERIEDVMIPDWTRVFIYPKKVSILPGHDMRDLVVRPEKDKTFQYDEQAVVTASQRIARTHKEDRKMVAASTLRGEVSTLSGVNYSIDGRVFQRDKESFIPVPLVSELDAILGDWSNAEEKKVVTDFMLFSFSMFG